MAKDKFLTCTICKKVLPASKEYFFVQKKGKYGLSNVCLHCQLDRESCGIGSKWHKTSAGKYIKPIQPNKGLSNKPDKKEQP